MSDDAWPVPESRDDVRLADDAFYRRQALGTLRSTEPGWTVPRYEVAPARIPGVAVRFGAEAALIISVAVIAGVYRFDTLVIVGLMAAAFLVTALSEWLAARSAFVPPVFAFLPPSEPEVVEALTIAATPREDPWEEGFEEILH